MNPVQLKLFLDEKVEKYNNRNFIELDPISIPHGFELKQDIEISGLFASILAWGNRKTIIKNCKRLMSLFDHSPYDFVLNSSATELKRLEGFVHRTFNATDLLFILQALKEYYGKNESLEDLFVPEKNAFNIRSGLIHFHNFFFSLPYAPTRSKKHISTPYKKSACKRLNMYLRWMVRNDHKVDFGIWKKIKTSQLVCPLDVHVHKIALQLGLTDRKVSNWDTAENLTNTLMFFDKEDPVKYDFALFGLGIEGNTIEKELFLKNT